MKTMKTILYCIIILYVMQPSMARNIFGDMLCIKESDCTADQCCAMTRKTGTSTGFCMPARQLGDQCAPTYIYGQSFTCGCKRGLTCALVEINNQHKKHRCVKVISPAKEHTEKNDFNVTDTTEMRAEAISNILLKMELKKSNRKRAT